MIRSRKNIPAGEENPYFLSFSDIMSGLLILFILLTITVSIQLTSATQQQESKLSENIKLKKELDKKEKQLEAEKIRYGDNTKKINLFLNEIVENLSKSGIKVEATNSMIIIPDEEVSFASGDHELDENGKIKIIEIGRVMYDILIKNKNYQLIESIFIEGHTDPTPLALCYKKPDGKMCVFSDGEDGNWELSVFRAISVLQIWTNTPSTKGMINLENQFNQPLFAISGYSKNRPWIGPKLVPYPNSKQRRINLRFNQKQIEFEDL